MKDSYQIEENSATFSFCPFHQHQSKLKWYVLAILIFGVLSAYYYKPINELFLVISTAFLIITSWFFLKEILLYIPIRYTFDRSTNGVYQRTLFVSKKKIMNLDELVIYQSSEMGTWQYKMGKKKSQFVKSYSISTYFSDKKNNDKAVAYEREILNRIEQMIIKSSSTIPANSGEPSFNILKKIKMLKSYLIFLCLSISFSGIAQQYQLDSVVHSTNGTQFISSQKYDAESRKAELVRYKQQGTNDVIKKMERSQVAYDDKGNGLCYIFSVWNVTGNTWDDEEKTEQEFNTNNKLIRVSSYRKNYNQWKKVFENRRLYAQDSIIETDYEIKDAKFQPTHRNISVINTFDKVKTYEIFLWNDKNQTWQPLTRTVNNYQKDSTMIGFETVEWKENQWQKQEKVEYELDKDNLPTDNYTIYKGQNNHWIPVTKFEEESLPEQNKKISRTYRWENINNKWFIYSQVETYLNKEGKKQDVLFSEVDISTRQLKLQLEQMYLYDKQGRLILFQDFYYANETRTGTQSTVKFDDQGNVIQEKMYEFDSEKDTWNEKMITEFVYYKDITLDSTFEAHKKIDLFSLNGYNYITNKSVPKQVRKYRNDNGKTVLSEEFEYFYSIAK